MAIKKKKTFTDQKYREKNRGKGKSAFDRAVMWRFCLGGRQRGPPMRKKNELCGKKWRIECGGGGKKRKKNSTRSAKRVGVVLNVHGSGHSNHGNGGEEGPRSFGRVPLRFQREVVLRATVC